MMRANSVSGTGICFRLSHLVHAFPFHGHSILYLPAFSCPLTPFCCNSLPVWNHLPITLIIIKTWIFSSPRVDVQSTNGVCACVVTSLYAALVSSFLVFYSLGNRFLLCPRSSACLSLTSRTTPLFFFHWPLTAATLCFWVCLSHDKTVSRLSCASHKPIFCCGLFN